MIETSVHGEPVALPSRSPGRVARSVAGYAVATALMLLSPAFVFIPAALLHCGIRNGRRAAWLALAIAVALLMPYFLQLPRTSSDGRLEIVLYAGLILGIGVPSLLALPLVERMESFGRVLMFAVTAAIGGLALTETGIRALAGFSPYAEQMARANEMTSQVVSMDQKMGMPFDLVQTLERWMSYGMAVLPAWFLMEVALVFALSLLMLGRLRAYRDLAATQTDAARAANVYRFRNLALPEWLIFAFVASGLTPLLSGSLQKVAANVLAVVAFLYLLQGLAIVRSMLASAGVGLVGLMFTFLTMAFLTITGIATLPLSIAGLFDSFFDFRHFKRKDDSHESHTD